MIGNRTEEELLTFIDSYWETYWTSPSYKQIGEFTGLKSKATVSWHLNLLVKKGLLERNEQPNHLKSVLYRRAV